MNCRVTCSTLWLLVLHPHTLVFALSQTQVPLAFSTLPSPPVRLDISGTSLIIRLQWSAMLTGCPLMAVPLPLRHGSTAAAAVRGGEVIIALPLSLQSQLVPVVLNVWLLLQSQVHLRRGKSAGCGETQRDQNEHRHTVLCAACGVIQLCFKRHVWMKDQWVHEDKKIWKWNRYAIISVRKIQQSFIKSCNQFTVRFKNLLNVQNLLLLLFSYYSLRF